MLKILGILQFFSLGFTCGNTTDELSERHVIQALKSHRAIGQVFPVVDFYLSLLKNGSDFKFSKNYSNVYELARQGFKGGDLFRTESTLSTTLVYDWLADVTEDYETSGDVAQRVVELIKSNQSVVNYYLKRSETTTRKMSEAEIEKFYAVALRAIDKNHILSTLDSSETITPAEIIESNTTQYTNVVSSSIISIKIIPTTSLPSSMVHNPPNCTREYTCSSRQHTNRFVQKLKRLVQQFKKSTEPQKPTTNKKCQTTSAIKSLKSKILKKIHRFYSNIKKKRRAIFLNFCIKPMEIGLVKIIKQFFQRNSADNITQATPKRHRRDVCETFTSNQTYENSQSKYSGGIKGLFQRIKNTFWKSKKVDPKLKEDQTRKEDAENKITFDPQSRTIHSKLSSDPSIHSSWIPYIINPREQKEFNRLHTSGNTVTITARQGKQHTVHYSTEFHKTREPDILLENAKKFIQHMYNTSETIAFTNMRDFIAGLSTRSGQMWWEALHERNETDEFLEEATENELWKFYKKSLTGNSETSRRGNNYYQRPNGHYSAPRTSQFSCASKHPPIYVQSENKIKITSNVDNIFQSEYPIQTRETSPRRETNTSTIDLILRKYFTSTIFHLDGRTFYRTQSPVFTFKKKPRTTQTVGIKSEEYLFVTDPPQLQLNETWDYECFCEFMRASLPPEYTGYFTDSFTSRKTQATIKKSLFDRIKQIFRGGKTSAEANRNKTVSQEDFDHYKNLLNILESKGNISQDEFNKRKLGNINLRWSYK